MRMQGFFVLCLAAVATGLTALERPYSLHPNDHIFLIPKSRRAAALPAGFHYIFVDASGSTSYTRGAVGTQVEIAGSPLTSQEALIVAADIVAKMTKYMPPSIFTQLATSASVGIFTAAEKLIVYPEYAGLANGNCGRNCTGSCSHTCTFDGRKYENIAGIGGRRGVVLDDNVLCTPQDPYLHTQNILSHEFTHTIHNNAVPASVKQLITTAYNTAKAKSTWVLSSYAMSNTAEYFAEGASVFFFVNQDNWSSGGMSFCGGKLCTSELEARHHLQLADPDLYDALSYVFTNNRPTLTSGLTICPQGTVVG